jgi:hypothetical protein
MESGLEEKRNDGGLGVLGKKIRNWKLEKWWVDSAWVYFEILNRGWTRMNADGESDAAWTAWTWWTLRSATAGLRRNWKIGIFREVSG